MANDFSFDANCLALYRFESGALTTDSKGSNTLTAVSDPAGDTVNYKEGSCAVVLDGNDSFKLLDGDLPSDWPFKSGTSNNVMSLTAWFRPTTLPGSGNYDTIASKTDPNFDRRSWSLDMENSQLRFAIGYNGGASSEAWYVVGLTASRWYHVGVTLDGNTKGAVVRLWDDTAASATTYTHTFTNSPSIDIADFRIGAMTNDTTSTNFMIGQIDELVYFKDIKTAEQIDQIRAGTYSTSSINNLEHAHTLQNITMEIASATLGISNANHLNIIDTLMLSSGTQANNAFLIF